MKAGVCGRTAHSNKPLPHAKPAKNDTILNMPDWASKTFGKPVQALQAYFSMQLAIHSTDYFE